MHGEQGLKTTSRGLFASGVQLFMIILLPAASPLGATFTINSTSDLPDANTADGVCDAGGGICTLRAAIQQGNALAGTDSAVFAIAGSGVRTIVPTSALPNITGALILDGWTQGGMSYTGPPL